MPRSRVLSFMSQWGGGPRSPTDASPSSKAPYNENAPPAARSADNAVATPVGSTVKLDAYALASSGTPGQLTVSRARGDSKRPTSMMHTYSAPHMSASADTPPELLPIFSYLNSHSSKLYQEGYFLKLHDLDSRGRPSQDRTWVECFAQLIGTVLSLWDAAALDAAGEDGEVVPSFINLSDASIKMIESLPMNGSHGGNLQNVISVSTAANNRYLLHFNSLNSLTQWTAGIRLAMFEHATLQEAYTGSLIAGKGRSLNNIKQIMERNRFVHEDWARVRFGAGTPWRRCWCVIQPPDEKEYAKAQKTVKKTSTYDRAKFPKGQIKFYDTRKPNKRTKPIATVTDAFAAYAIYPQSRPLIDQSTLVKLEGLITIQSPTQATTTEGFIFVMPEVHPAVTGFEMMLRWLFPVFDTFCLYGRPARLIADSLDQRGLMFAMPKERKYGYLDILDVSSLIHTKGNQGWSERQWRREMKKITGQRMMTQLESPAGDGRQMSQRRASANVRFGNGSSIHSTPGSRSGSPGLSSNIRDGGATPPHRVDSAPPGQLYASPHKRAVSDAAGYRRQRNENPSRLSYENLVDGEDAMEDVLPPQPPPHRGAVEAAYPRRPVPNALQRIHSEPEVPKAQPLSQPPAPVGAPPTMMHPPNSRPPTQPFQAPELRREHSIVDAATLYQMHEVSHPPPNHGAGHEGQGGAWTAEVLHRQQNTVASPSALRDMGASTDPSPGMVRPSDPRSRLSPPPVASYPVGGLPQSVSSPALVQGSAQSKSLPPSIPLQKSFTIERRPSPQRSLHSSSSVLRKPVPKPASADTSTPRKPLPSSRSNVPSVVEPDSPVSPVNTEGFEGELIDDEALERVLNHERQDTLNTQPMQPDPPSIGSASSRPRSRSPDKARAGKLRTVGDPAMGLNEQPANTIPTIDLGPTFAYKPNSRPGTGSTLYYDTSAETQYSNSHSHTSSRDDLGPFYGANSAQPSPYESTRPSYFGGAGRNSPSSGYRTPTGFNDLAAQQQSSLAVQHASASSSRRYN